MNEILNDLSESNFMHYIVCTICNYAKENGYGVTKTAKTIGEGLVGLSGVCDFDNLEENF